jgi:hypothetical protein
MQRRRSIETNQTARISLQIPEMSKSRDKNQQSAPSSNGAPRQPCPKFRPRLLKKSKTGVNRFLVPSSQHPGKHISAAGDALSTNTPQTPQAKNEEKMTRPTDFHRTSPQTPVQGRPRRGRDRWPKCREAVVQRQQRVTPESDDHRSSASVGTVERGSFRPAFGSSAAARFATSRASWDRSPAPGPTARAKPAIAVSQSWR